MVTVERTQSIGIQVRNARREKEWSQDQLGERCGMTGGNIWRIENGYSTTTDALARIAQALRVKLSVVFE
jgi:transcriptional regulator with XRE-family HTH domain|tara:strand:+ start:92 stop:301 length:210 start_codon:yes stop_codon:yes gene_type:complete